MDQEMRTSEEQDIRQIEMVQTHGEDGQRLCWFKDAEVGTTRKEALKTKEQVYGCTVFQGPIQILPLSLLLHLQENLQWKGCPKCIFEHRKLNANALTTTTGSCGSFSIKGYRSLVQV